MQQVKQQHDYTIEEYLALEEQIELKNEYHAGQIIAITGGTFNHNRILGNIGASLNFHFKGQKNYDVAIGDVKVWIPEMQCFLYPDIMVVHGDIEYYQNRQDTIINPLVIFEVLSKPTQNYDKGEKFQYYRGLPSFQEYILICQDNYHVEHYTKVSDYEWRITYQDDPKDVLKLRNFSFEMSLADIYHKVNW